MMVPPFFYSFIIKLILSLKQPSFLIDNYGILLLKINKNTLNAIKYVFGCILCYTKHKVNINVFKHFMIGIL